MAAFDIPPRVYSFLSGFHREFLRKIETSEEPEGVWENSDPERP